MYQTSNHAVYGHQIFLTIIKDPNYNRNFTAVLKVFMAELKD